MSAALQLIEQIEAAGASSSWTARDWASHGREPFCQYRERCAKSPGSSPDNATKNHNEINKLKACVEVRSFAFFGLVELFRDSARYESSGTVSVPRERKAYCKNSAWPSDGRTTNLPRLRSVAEAGRESRPRMRSAAARSLSLDSGPYASAHISQYPGNVINGGAAISSPHES